MSPLHPGPRSLEAYTAWIEADGAAEHLELDTSQRDHLADAMWLGKITGKAVKNIGRWENHEEMMEMNGN